MTMSLLKYISVIILWSHKNNGQLAFKTWVRFICLFFNSCHFKILFNCLMATFSKLSRIIIYFIDWQFDRIISLVFGILFMTYRNNYFTYRTSQSLYISKTLEKSPRLWDTWNVPASSPNLIENKINDYNYDIEKSKYILKADGVYLLPADIGLSSIEVKMLNTINR